MEAHGVRSFPPDSVRGRFVRRALQAAVVDVILPRFAEQILHAALAGAPLSRDMAGRAMVYLQARTHYGIVDPAVLGALDVIWRRTLGADDLRALDELFARLVWIEDGDLDALDRAARAYRDIIGPPDPPPAGEGAAGQGDARRYAGTPVAKERRTAVTVTASSRASGRWPTRSSTRSSTPAPGSSSSSTRTSTSSSCSARRRRPRPTGARWRPRDRPAERADARPRRRPPAVRRRDPAGAPLRHPPAPGDHARHAPDRQAHARRALRRARLRARTGATRDRPARQRPPVAASRARCARRSRPRTSG